MIKAPMRGVPVSLFDDEAADETISDVLAIPSSFHEHQLTIKVGAGVTDGQVTLEASDDPEDAGTWSPITSAIDTTTASSTIVYNWSGVYQFIRARINEIITGGTIDTSYVGS